MPILVVLIFFLLSYNYFTEISSKEKNSIATSIEIEQELLFNMEHAESINQFKQFKENKKNTILDRPEVKKIISNILKRSKLEDIAMLEDLIILERIQDQKLNDNLKQEIANKNKLELSKELELNEAKNQSLETINQIQIEKNAIETYQPFANSDNLLNEQVNNLNNDNIFDKQINTDNLFILKINKHNQSYDLVGTKLNQNIQINDQIFTIINIIKPFKYDHVRYFLLKNDQYNIEKFDIKDINLNNNYYKLIVKSLKTNKIILEETINIHDNLKYRPIIFQFLLNFVNDDTDILAFTDKKLLDISNEDKNLNELIKFYYTIYNSKFNSDELITIEIKKHKK